MNEIQAKVTRDAERDKLTGYQLQAMEIQRQLDELEGCRRDCKISEGFTPILVQRAQAMLEGRTVDDLIDGDVKYKTIMDKIDKLKDGYRVTLKAIELQKEILRFANSEYSRIFCAEHKDEFAELIREHAAAFIAHSKSMDKIESFLNNMAEDGITSNYCLGPWRKTGSLSYPHSNINTYLGELRKGGWIDEQELETLKAA